MFTKNCTKCDIKQSINSFPFKNKVKNTRNNVCKKCQRTISNNHYKAKIKKYGKKYLIKLKVQSKKRKEKLHDKVWDYLCMHPCVDCGESDPIVLEFDHVKGKKLNNIMTLVNWVAASSTLDEEIKKCSVRCANCHRRITVKRSKSWRSRRKLSS